jgi:hypothetical protein
MDSDAVRPSPQLGKLRAFEAGSGADLGERLISALVGQDCVLRDSPLDLVRCGAVPRRMDTQEVP